MSIWCPRGTDAASLDDPVVIGMLDNAYAALGAGTALASIVAGAAQAYADGRLGAPDRAPDVLAAALAVEVSNGAGSLPDDSPRPVFDFARFGLGNPPPLLRDAYDSAMTGPDGTPNDPNNILYGTRLNHFAAFADPDWRDWDWMWGRMNALARLARLLGLNDDEVNDLTKAILAAEGRQLPGVQDGISDGDELHRQGNPGPPEIGQPVPACARRTVRLAPERRAHQPATPDGNPRPWPGRIGPSCPLRPRGPR